MKTNPFLIALSLLVGGLVVLMAVSMMNKPVQAETPSGNGIGGFSAITLSVDNSKSVLICFREVDNMLPNSEGKVVGMSMYEVQTQGGGKAEIKLIGTRYVDYDTMVPEYINKDGRPASVEFMKDLIEKTKNAPSGKGKGKDKEK